MNRSQENYERWLSSSKVSAEDKEILRKMDEKEIDDAFYQDIEFGTAGMRGILGPGTNRMNLFTVKKATIAFALFLLEKYPNAREAGVVISHDNRHMSREFTLNSASILNKMGIKAYIFDDLRPTPELSFAVRHLKTVGGIMITASHNPKEYNGYKVYDECGCQLVPFKIARLLKIIKELPNELDIEAKADNHPGKTIVLSHDVDDEYVALVEGISLERKLDKKGFKIVYTPQHGTSYENAMRVFHDLGYKIYPVAAQCVHDPDFGATLSPNPEVESAYIEPLKLAHELDANLIVMTDPDGDRCGLAYKKKDGSWERLNGNQSAALLLEYMCEAHLRHGDLPANGVIYDTIVSSSLARKIAEHYGLKVETFLTGFKYIGERIHHYEVLGGGPTFFFGYEESYGCLIAPFVRDKDGLQAILLYSEMANYYYRQGKTLDEVYMTLLEKYGGHYTLDDSLAFKGSEGQKEMKNLLNNLRVQTPKEIGGLSVIGVDDYLKGRTFDLLQNKEEEISLDRSDVLRFRLEDGSWIAIRPSGTEPKCKFYIEACGSAHEDLKKKAQKLLESFKAIALNH